MPDNKAITLDPKALIELAADCRPNPEGILCCLHMLAEEAAELNLTQTLNALKRAMGACAVETMAMDEHDALLMALERPSDSHLN